MNLDVTKVLQDLHFVSDTVQPTCVIQSTTVEPTPKGLNAVLSTC